MKENKHAKNITPLNLKESLKKEVGDGTEVTLFCINNCKRCYLLKEDMSITPLKGKINLGRDFEAIVLNRRDDTIAIDDFGRIKDQKVCFKFKLYKNGSSTKYIISNSEGVYFLPSYFGTAKEVKDIDQAKELWIKEEFNLKDNANYY